MVKKGPVKITFTFERLGKGYLIIDSDGATYVCQNMERVRQALWEIIYREGFYD